MLLYCMTASGLLNGEKLSACVANYRAHGFTTLVSGWTVWLVLPSAAKARWGSGRLGPTA